MQIVFLSPLWMIILFFTLWPVLQISCALIALAIPNRAYDPDSFFYRSHRFELEGKLYERLFAVKKWKHLLPDGGAVFKKRGYKKKKLESFSKENLELFLVESARGELTHWLAIFPFWIFGFFAPPYIILIMLAYALIVNLPCIIVQRYNRPRIKKILKMMNK
ncbi:MAG: glycosyl-4,4'-diaponeurosporenoate acyltransferase [Bacilli bacterium]|jgi:glycosyl-4,4'-diaponeurosporenoate acyltransferase|nr:glycosyl-4,4'-diaponeurosporenoate acyltransferase [Bacilli bacterium]MCH4202476.1 glycosyl-4,4'-diaponeurosporenoate acyltransferase [Bacilli bacterium]MCH4235207.1 glycosyl-4,4'-diaponeurosporenoate acyltransferase [Bacilli bacterium]